MQWWDDHDAVVDKGLHDAPEDQDALINPALDPSPRGRLDGFVETFVSGWPRRDLIRKVGFGMHPPFQRMREPFAGVVEMRTQATRTFGYFVRKGVYVAYRLATADATHSNPTLYQQYGGDVAKLLANMIPSDKDVVSDVEDLIGD